MSTRLPSLPSALLAVVLTMLGSAPRARAEPPVDLLVVGAGAAGLAAALEAGQQGARVEVLDAASVFGGHAVMAFGGVWLVGTPEQRAQEIHDSPELALEDLARLGRDIDRDWAGRYVRGSVELHRWLTGLGVEFTAVSQPSGNSVPRFHNARGRGLGLVAPLYRRCLDLPNIRFRWNTRAVRLVVEQGQVVGVDAEEVRTGRTRGIRARAVLLATGGFQNNLELVRAHWPRHQPLPARILKGSGVNSTGSGLHLATAVGAAVHRMDHMWNYTTGMPDPRYPGEERGLNVLNPHAILVNARGERFVHDDVFVAGNQRVYQALLSQPGVTCWMVFDSKGKEQFGVSGTDWSDRKKVDALVLDNPALVRKADTLAELATRAGLPPDVLAATVQRYNGLVALGADEDFGRFKNGKWLPPRLEAGPFYAAQLWPLARKSMGGLKVDRATRVVDAKGKRIRGLYAAGEVTGFAGINGSAALEGTFLGPALFMGRLTGKTVVADLRLPRRVPPTATPVKVPVPTPVPASAAVAAAGPAPSCAQCHTLSLDGAPGPGRWHFQLVHRRVRQQQAACTPCHAELHPYDPARHRIDPKGQLESCSGCHQPASD